MALWFGDSPVEGRNSAEDQQQVEQGLCGVGQSIILLEKVGKSAQLFPSQNIDHNDIPYSITSQEAMRKQANHPVQWQQSRFRKQSFSNNSFFILLSKYAINWSKVIVKTFRILQKHCFKKMCYYFELYSSKNNYKNIIISTKILSSTTTFMCVTQAPNRHIRMISEEFCNTNAAENLALVSQE